MTAEMRDLGSMLRAHYVSVADEHSSDATLIKALAETAEISQLTWPWVELRRPISPALKLALVTAILVTLLVALAVAFGTRPRLPQELRHANGAIVIAVDGAVGNDLLTDAGDPRPATHIADLYAIRDGAANRVVGAAGDGLHQTCPAFSTDGLRLAYVEAALVAGQTGAQRPISASWILHINRVQAEAELGDSEVTARLSIPLGASGGGAPCIEWSPDGRHLAFLAGDGVHLLTLEQSTSGTTSVVDFLRFGATADGSGWANSDLAWSRDGSMLAYLQGFAPSLTGDTSEVWLLPLQHNQPRVLRAGSPSDIASLVAWSPDGLKIAVIVDSPDNATATRRLVTLDLTAGSGQPVQVDEWSAAVGSGLAWSANGRLAYIRNNEVVVRDSAGAGSTVFAPADLPDVTPVLDLAWSPDQTRLAFLGERHGSYALIAVPGESHGAQVLTPWTTAIYPPVKGEFTWQLIEK